MKRQRNEKPIDEELLMRMMAGEAAGTGEPGTGKEETAVPVEKAQEGKAAETRRRKGRQADYETTFLKGMDIPPATASRSMCAVSTTSASPKSR